jgi:hypothetical protein
MLLSFHLHATHRWWTVHYMIFNIFVSIATLKKTKKDYKDFLDFYFRLSGQLLYLNSLYLKGWKASIVINKQFSKNYNLHAGHWECALAWRKQLAHVMKKRLHQDRTGSHRQEDDLAGSRSVAWPFKAWAHEQFNLQAELQTWGNKVWFLYYVLTIWWKTEKMFPFWV